MKKTLFSLIAFILVGTGTFAQHIQATIRYDAASEDAIVTIRNNGTASYVGDLTSFDITVYLQSLDFRLRRMTYLFSSEPANPEVYTNFGFIYYHFNWAGSFAIDLAPGETLDLFSAKLKDTWISTEPPVVGIAALGQEVQHLWSVKIDNIEEGEPINRFYNPDIPGAYFFNNPFGSRLEVPAQFALPVELTRFTALKERNSVKLDWTTTEEKSSSSFEVQQSTDSKNWEKIGSIAASGESNAPQHYSFSHHPGKPGNNYYRLKMIDTDLSYAFSKIEVVNIESRSSAIYPNPVETYLSLEGIDTRNATSVKIYNTLGRLVTQYEVLKIPVLVEQLLPGNYIAVIQNRDGSLVNCKFVKR